MANKLFEDQTYCTFGKFCKSAPTCKQVLTQPIYDESEKQKAWLRLYIQPPKHCFIHNGVRK